MFKLALAQMRVEPGAKRANLERASRRIVEAAALGARIILLPEAMDAGWADPRTATIADPIPGGQTCRTLQALARQHSIQVCAGITERDGHGEVYNAAVLISAEGEILIHHRKIHELEFARACYGRGDRLRVADTPLGRIGVMICADAFAPGQAISRSLGLMDAALILSPCAWAVPADHDNLREPYGQLWLDHYCPVAREYRLWIAGASNVGPIERGAWAGRRCIGSSLVIDGTGRKVLQGPYGEDADCLLTTEVQLRPRG